MSLNIVTPSTKQPTPFEQMQPRVKLLTFLALLITVVNLSDQSALVLSFAGIVGILVLARARSRFVLLRLLLVLPFTGLVVLLPFVTPGQPAFLFGPLVASSEGLQRALLLGTRLVEAVLLITALTVTTPVGELFTAMSRLRVPTLFILLAKFALRYVGVLSDEVARMRRAQRSRGFVARSVFHPATLQALARLFGMAFIRALERAERIYQAMRARNYRGTPQAVPQSGASLTYADYGWLTAVTGFIVFILLVERGYWL